jgi:hypothetical protein
MPKFSDTSIPWDDYFARPEPLQRYQYTIKRNSLSDYDRKKVSYALGATSPTEAIRRSEQLLQKGEVGFFAKEFLNALIISAETDLHLQ